MPNNSRHGYKMPHIFFSFKKGSEEGSFLAYIVILFLSHSHSNPALSWLFLNPPKCLWFRFPQCKTTLQEMWGAKTVLNLRPGLAVNHCLVLLQVHQSFHKHLKPVQSKLWNLLGFGGFSSPSPLQTAHFFSWWEYLGVCVLPSST